MAIAGTDQQREAMESRFVATRTASAESVGDVQAIEHGDQFTPRIEDFDWRKG